MALVLVVGREAQAEFGAIFKGNGSSFTLVENSFLGGSGIEGPDEIIWRGPTLGRDCYRNIGGRGVDFVNPLVPGVADGFNGTGDSRLRFEANDHVVNLHVARRSPKGLVWQTDNTGDLVRTDYLFA